MRKLLAFLLVLIGSTACDSSRESGFDPSYSEAFRPEARESAELACEGLDFDGINVLSSLTAPERRAFELALGISSSFEGGRNFQNLSNNFDGQGLSIGLLNQSLGQGSLQPIWMEMRDRHPDALEGAVGHADLVNLLAMLKDYGSGVSAESVSSDLRNSGFSELDDPEMVNQELRSVFTPRVVRADRNSRSVKWALRTLYSDRSGFNFKAEWKKELTALAGTVEYKNIQVEKARALHIQALKYFDTFDCTELRSYLFFFDLIVQNGGLSVGVQEKAKAYLKIHPSLNETAKLTSILNFRLPYVRKIFQPDVKARKLAIINGIGQVHGRRRNLPSEYCADFSDTVEIGNSAD